VGLQAACISDDPPHCLQVSYVYLLLTNLFTSLYTVYINVIKKSTNLNVFGLLYYNTVTTLPVLFVLAWVSGDLTQALNFKHYGDFMFEVSFQASIILAFMLNVSTFYCTTLNTARTQTVVGQLKNFFAFLLGLMLFNDYIYDRINFIGLLIGFAGGVQYSYVTYAEKQEKDAKTKQETIKDVEMALDKPTLAPLQSDKDISTNKKDDVESQPQTVEETSIDGERSTLRGRHHESPTSRNP
jgi:hypothetical protein